MLSQGAIITGLLWGSITAFLIDGKLLAAALFSMLTFLLSVVGLIHSERLGLTFSPVAVGYLILTLLIVVLYAFKVERGQPVDIEQNH